MIVAAAFVCPPLASQPAPPPEPSGYRLDDHRSPVPATLQGARVIGAEEAQKLKEGGAAVFVDVYPRPSKPPNLPKDTIWRDPVHETIEGAVWLPNVGYGVLAPEMDAYFRAQLEALAAENLGEPFVFFCEKDCWMSWNAAKRALSYGYKNVIWFRDGTNAWLDLGETLVKASPRS